MWSEMGNRCPGRAVDRGSDECGTTLGAAETDPVRRSLDE
jgi:hypothetical protein